MDYSYFISQATKYEQKAMACFARADFYSQYSDLHSYHMVDWMEDQGGFYAREAVRYYNEASIAKS